MSRNAKLFGGAAAVVAALGVSTGSYALLAAECGADVCVGDSWQAAYAAAQPGQVLTVQSGTHAGQTLSYVAAKGGETDTADVTFRASGTVQVGTLTLYGLRHVTFDGIKAGGVLFECEDTAPAPLESRGHHPVDVTYKNGSMSYFRTENAALLTIANNTIGPSSTVIKISGSGDDGGANCTDEPPTSTVVEDNDIHNFREATAASHMECVFVEGTRGLIIRRNIIRGCSVFSLFFKQQLSGGAFGMSNIVIENNMLGHPVASAFRAAGGTAMSFSGGSGTVYSNLVVRGNSANGAILLRTDLGVTFPGARIENNLMVSRGGACVGQTGNAYLADNQMCPGDVADAINPGWVDVETSAEINSATSDPTIDYHLADGAWPINRVQSGGTEDFDRQARPFGAAYDIGADEHGGGTTPPTPPPPPPPTPPPPPPPPTCPGSSGTLTLTKTAEDATTVTLSWTPPAGATGYRFSTSASTVRTHTWDGTRSSVRFAKATCYRVEALSVLSEGAYG